MAARRFRDAGSLSACSLVVAPDAAALPTVADISVPRDVAEGLILAPVVEKLLSPRFVEHAVKTIRELARREREAPPAEGSAAVAHVDTQIAELERLVREGLVTPTVAAPALAKARSERQAALRATTRRPSKAPDSLAFAAEAAFREMVTQMAKVLQGENQIEARELLSQIVGTVRLQRMPKGIATSVQFRGRDVRFRAAISGSRRTPLAPLQPFNVRLLTPQRSRSKRPQCCQRQRHAVINRELGRLAETTCGKGGLH
jgi:hypothetical protein